VVRNRVKRLLREAVRALEPLMDTPTDVVVVARSEILAATMPEVRRALELAAASAGLTRIRPAREGTST
jgi:ribonuclease P protein component